MAIRYDLPKTNDGAGLLRMLMIWGLPILLWLLLIFWWFCSSSDEEPAQAVPLAPTSPMSAAPAPSNVPARPIASSDAAVKAEPSVAPSKATAIHMAGSTYDFSGARAEIPGLDLRECRAGILVDVDQHRVLWAKKANSAVPIASMTKMMTLLLVEEAIANGTVQRDAMIRVTKGAFSIGGTQVWLDPKETFPLSELMKAVAIRSANDAAYLVGEYLASGNMEAFVQSMNARAKALGMKDTYFYDPHGLGDKAKNQHNTSSAYDMILLGERVLAFPEIMKLTSTRLDSFREGKTQLRNSNNLVFNRVEGVDGLKTGYTEASGFCVTFSFKRDERRFLGCVTGFKTAKQRDAFCKKLIEWATTVH